MGGATDALGPAAAPGGLLPRLLIELGNFVTFGVVNMKYNPITIAKIQHTINPIFKHSKIRSPYLDITRWKKDLKNVCTMYRPQKSLHIAVFISTEYRRLVPEQTRSCH